MKKVLLAVLAVVLIGLIAFGVWKFFDKAPEPTEIEKLYTYNGTYIGDASNVRKIADLVNFAGLPVEKIELLTDEDQPKRLNVSYMVPSRANYRFAGGTDFEKNAAVMYALIPNLDEIVFYVFDEYSEDINKFETSFSSGYSSRDTLYQHYKFENYTTDYINNACESIDTFNDYYNNVSAIQKDEPSPYLVKLYDFIGDDHEIIINSGYGANFDITEDFLASDDCRIIEETMGLSLDEYLENTISLSIDILRNFKTDEKSAIAYFSTVDNDFISPKIITYEEEEILKEQIIKRY